MKEETNKMESIEGGAMEEARHSYGGDLSQPNLRDE